MPAQTSPRHRPQTAVKLGLLLAWLLSACQPAPTPDDSAIYTQAAITMQAQLTIQAGETAVAQLTSIASQPSPTPPPPTPLSPPTEVASPTPTNAPLPTDTPLPSPTPPPPPPSATPLPCDQAEFVKDITIPPGSSFPLGASFIKTWRVRNVGTCTWSRDYTLMFINGNNMGGNTFISLPGSVAPGQSLDLSITLTAPSYPGAYQGEWMLRNAGGALFGVGADGQQPLVVRINAVQPSFPQSSDIDLAANYCAAAWNSATGPLTCPGIPADPNGSVTLQERVDAETGRLRGLTLLAYPNQERDGWVRGQYPAYRVRQDDHFLADVGCLAQDRQCNLIFQLEYRANDGTKGTLGTWDEAYDGSVTSIDIDLSPLAGKSVQFILLTYNNGRPRDASGFWFEPRIEKQAFAATLVLDWTRETTQPASCSALRVSLFNQVSGQAQAFSCQGGERKLGQIALSPEDLAQMLEWYQKFNTFEAEVYRASPTQPISFWIYFDGVGGNKANDANIQAINGFAARLFAQIAGGPIIE